jgi:hypothetical protein
MMGGSDRAWQAHAEAPQYATGDVAANLPGSGPILISKDFGKGSNEPTGRVGAARR